MSGQYRTAWLCEALLVSRSGYYAWIRRRRCPGPRQLENIRLRQRVREEFARSRQTYGSPRLAQVLGLMISNTFLASPKQGVPKNLGENSSSRITKNRLLRSALC